MVFDRRLFERRGGIQRRLVYGERSVLAIGARRGERLPVKFPVLLDPLPPLGRDCELVEDGVHGAGGLAVGAVDADGGVDEVLVYLVGGGDAINGADLNAGGVFDPDTRFSD
tara:strand:+ start:5581 stop:5916 length:336 start_codon:yes stop_codon:yes gene_type:complete